MSDLCFLSVRDTVKLLKDKQLSAHELMRAYLERIGRFNPKINAIVGKLDDEACLALARAADMRMARGEPVGVLHGLPWAFKDIEPAVGFPWTRGSPIFKHARAEEDSVLVERLKQAGVIPIGKTNVPEFGMGSHTFNSVYGTTVNPFDPSKSAGGSSGGAGAAVAAGFLPAADGSDLGGSLRNPANFNNIVGFRPSVGLVPNAPTTLPFLGFAVKGPIARNVADAALLLSVMAGQDPRDPACEASDPKRFAQLQPREFKGTRIAFCPDLGGLPLDPKVRQVLHQQRRQFEELGCEVEDAAPDLQDADEVFLTLRAFRSFVNFAPLLALKRAELKPEAVEEIEQGAAFSAAQIAKAMLRHTQLVERMRVFQERYEFVVCAVNQVPPFDATLRFPTEIDGKPMRHYVEWMQSAYWISTTFHPAISVPAGFTSEGLPVGVQIVGRMRDDLGLLQFARAFEQATRVGERRPTLG